MVKYEGEYGGVFGFKTFRITRLFSFRGVGSN